MLILFNYIDGATTEKARLEDKQRISRKQRRNTKDEWRPRLIITCIMLSF